LSVIVVVVVAAPDVSGEVLGEGDVLYYFVDRS
jgi:hypothetical protein